MKTAFFYGPGDIRIEERPEPDIGDGDILIKVKACAICGTDLRIFKSGHHSLKPPQIIGHEISGIIEKKGRDVSDFKLGERVAVDPIVSCGSCYYCKRGMTNLCSTFKKTTEAFGYYYPGGFAEYMAIPEKAIKRGNLIRIPDSISFEEAAIAEPMGCALNGELLSQTGAGDTVLIIGAGPIGVMHASLARVLGATNIVISEISDNRLKMAEDIETADYYINPENEDLNQLLYNVSEGIGPNVIIVAAPSKKAQEEAVKIAANRAHICFFGGLPKDNNISSIDSNMVHYKELFINGSSGATTEHIKICIDFMGSGRIDGKKFISKIINIEDIPGVMHEIDEGRYLKVVVRP
jgi:L-iditol 2-dehydrogenase